MSYREVNFDGLVGPTHNYAGLSFGNVASASNRQAVSNPRAAALQGLEKARCLAGRGFPQAILPPHERPLVAALRAWGFDAANDAGVLAKTAKSDPHLLAAASSASAMWTANAWTTTPSCDTADQKVHFTPANLNGNLHRSLEAPFTQTLLRTVFAYPALFRVHPPLPGGSVMADEGAANHTRLQSLPHDPGFHLFVYGRCALDHRQPAPARFPARQTRESVTAIARLHRIPPGAACFLQQAPEAVDAGVFHNDVISVGTADTFLYHEEAFLDGSTAIDRLRRGFESMTGFPLQTIRVDRNAVSLEEAVKTYLFNSQLLLRPEGGLLLAAPGECRESGPVSRLLEEWLADPVNPLADVLYFDLRESMRNGGGPACLRQRVVLNEPERAAMAGRLFLDDALHAELAAWVRRHYREELHPEDLADPTLLNESRAALDELTGILRLPPLYPFQQ